MAAAYATENSMSYTEHDYTFLVLQQITAKKTQTRFRDVTGS